MLTFGEKMNVNHNHNNKMLSESDLSCLPVDALEKALRCTPRVRGPRQLDDLAFKIQKAFRHACLSGEIERIKLFLERLPDQLNPLSKRLLVDRNALSWAAHGGQAHVIEYLCSRQHDSDFMGYDYDAGLEVLVALDALREGRPISDEHVRVEFSGDAAASSMAVVYRIAVERQSLELLGVLEDRIAWALDQQIEYQMRNRNRG